MEEQSPGAAQYSAEQDANCSMHGASANGINRRTQGESSQRFPNSSVQSETTDIFDFEGYPPPNTAGTADAPTYRSSFCEADRCSLPDHIAFPASSIPGRPVPAQHQRVSLPLTHLDSASRRSLPPLVASTQNVEQSRFVDLLSLSPPVADEAADSPTATAPHLQSARRTRSGNDPDRRGKSPETKRWRLYCFRRVFVVEPNIPHEGIRYNAEKILPLMRMGREAAPGEGVGSKNDDAAEQSSSVLSIDLPQLIIYRHTNDIAEVKNGAHQLYKNFGPLEQLFLIDCLIGEVHIDDARFLAVVEKSEVTAGFCSSSFSPASDQPNPPSEYPEVPDLHVCRVKRAWLIPYHLRLDNLKLRSSPIARVDGGNPYGNDSAASVRPSSRHPAKPLHRRGSFKLRRNEVGRARSEERCEGTDGVAVLEEEDDGSAEHRSSSTHPESQTDMSGWVVEGSVDEASSRVDEGVTDSVDDRRVHRSVNDRNLKRSASSDRRCARRSSEGSRSVTIPVSSASWDFIGFGCPDFNSLLGEKLANYKQAIEKLLMTSFYYSYDFELTLTFQRKKHLGLSFSRQGWPCFLKAPLGRANKESSHAECVAASTRVDRNSDLLDGLLSEGSRSGSMDSSSADDISYMQVADYRFVWNAAGYRPFQEYEVDPKWFTPLIQGSVTSAVVTAGRQSLDLFLICRRSCRRAGTRYIHRGIDSAGNVSISWGGVSDFMVSPFIDCASHLAVTR